MKRATDPVVLMSKVQANALVMEAKSRGILFNVTDGRAHFTSPDGGARSVLIGEPNRHETALNEDREEGANSK